MDGKKLRMKMRSLSKRRQWESLRDEESALASYSRSARFSEADAEFKPDILALSHNNAGSILLARANRGIVGGARGSSASAVGNGL